MKILKKVLSIVLCLVVLFCAIAIGRDGFAGEFDSLLLKASAEEYSFWDIIDYGTYPQTDVTEELGNILNGLGESWKTYYYYSGDCARFYGKENGHMSPSNFMYYKDVSYEGNRYRGVVFDQYRPSKTCCQLEDDDGYQLENGYIKENVYWFKYEPIQWRVLDPDSGLVMCETILDCQPFNNYGIVEKIDENRSILWGNPEQTYYGSNYENSSIRTWLSDNFYNTAFSEEQKANIELSLLNNDGYTQQPNREAIIDEPTNDKVFLLSYDEAYKINSTDKRKGKGSDYAKCQGLPVNDAKYSSGYYGGNSIWFLRTPDETGTVRDVDISGDVLNTSVGVSFSLGIRPAMRLSKLCNDRDLTKDYSFYFKSVSKKPKYTKKANKSPADSDKAGFINWITRNDLASIRGTEKDQEIKDKLYNIMFKAKYRPTVFGAKETDIKEWPFQNAGKSGKKAYDSGLDKNVNWDYSCRGCMSYACFVAKYVHGKKGAEYKEKTGCNVHGAEDIKRVVEAYADPGEVINYNYTRDGKKKTHTVAYMGHDDSGFYFLSYEGGKSKSGTYHILDLEYVTYERLAKSCDNRKFYVWDTNGGTYKNNSSQSNPTIKDVRVTVSKAGTSGVTVNYGDSKTGMIKSSVSRMLGNSEEAVNEYIMHFNDNEGNTIVITADGSCTIDCNIEYLTEDGIYNTRFFKNIPIDGNKTAEVDFCSCLDQTSLLLYDSKTDEELIYSCGIDETVTEPESQDEYDPEEDEDEESPDDETTVDNKEENYISAQINVKSGEVYKNSKVTVIAEASDVPDEYFLAIYDGDKEVKRGGNTVVIYELQDLVTNNKTLTVKVIDEDGNVQKDKDGNDLTDNIEIKVKTGFLNNIIAFFKKLFGSNKAIIKP